jgi:hypothetical protein
MKVIYNADGTVDFTATREIALGNPSEFDVKLQGLKSNIEFLKIFIKQMNSIKEKSDFNKTI